MHFKAIDSVPGKITKGQTYAGNITTVIRTVRVGDVSKTIYGIRALVFDDTGTWMTFNPKIFVPATMHNAMGIPLPVVGT